MAINAIPEISLEKTALPFIEQPIFDAAQQEVIDHEQGFCLVTGRAGTGKTNLLRRAENRTSHTVHTGSQKISAITFRGTTNREFYRTFSRCTASPDCM